MFIIFKLFISFKFFICLFLFFILFILICNIVIFAYYCLTFLTFSITLLATAAGIVFKSSKATTHSIFQSVQKRPFSTKNRLLKIAHTNSQYNKKLIY